MAISVEKKVGFFFILAMILLGAMLEVGEKWNPFEKKIPYRTYLSSVTGLKIGDPVRLVGVDVGRITKIVVLDEKVEVDFEVKPGTKIKTDTIAMLRLTNLLGGQFLGLSLGSPAAPILPGGGTVKGRDVANIDIIVDNVSALTSDAKQLISDLNRNQNRVMGQVSDILTDNRTSLRQTIANLDSITAKLDRGEGSLAMLLNDRALYTEAQDAVGSLKSVTAKIDKGEGTLGRLVNDGALYTEAKATLTDLRAGIGDMNAGFKDFKELTAKANRGEGTIGKLITDDSLYTELRDASRNVKEIAEKINSGKGTVGRLVNEDGLYRDATATLKKTENAMEGLGDSGPLTVLGTIVGTLF